MVSIDFDASQLNRLATDMGKVAGKAVPLAAKAVRKTAADIEREAKAFVPVDTGNLKNSITTTAIGLAAEIGPTAEYGIYVELGTSRVGPAAYMGPAFDRRAHELETALLSIAEDLGR